MAYIIGAKRSAIGTFLGALSQQPIADIAGQVAVASLQSANISPDYISETILGNVLPHGQGMNLARQTADKAGIPHKATAFTINQVCASGLRSVALAHQMMANDMIESGDVMQNHALMAGGLETMSNIPHMVQMRFGNKLGDATLIDAVQHDGLNCALADCGMGVTAENLAEQYAISRDAQDAFAYQSQLKTDKAIKAGLFADEIVPYIYQKRGNAISFETDEHPRLTELSALATLKPVFKKDGTVTAGNASGINDGAAIVIVGNEAHAQNVDASAPIARITGWATSGVAPDIMGIGPVSAIQQLLAKTNMGADDIDAFEINEAFAVQVLAVLKGLAAHNIIIPPEKLNPRGGAIALGHPLGASGARVLVTLLHHLKQEKLKRGIAALCVGGGMGIALMVEMV